MENRTVSPSITVLGNFDGFHRGHAALLQMACRLQEETGLPITVWSFSELSGKVLTSSAERRALLLAAGADRVIYQDFHAVKDLSPETFVREVLTQSLNTAYAVCGYNYTFGQGGKGDANLLRSLLETCGRACYIVDEVQADGRPISSTRIRQCLGEGQIGEAAFLLGRPYTLTATVEAGYRLGRVLGFPTANQSFPAHRCLPRRGVYAATVCLGGKTYPAVTNVGCRPTVRQDGRTVVETYIHGFSGDLYGQDLAVTLHDYLREEQSFPDTDILCRAIADDLARAQELTAPFTDSVGE